MYFCNMNTEIDAIRQYLEARKAVRNATNPKAFLRLGKLYAQGIGTKENHVLSNYFYEKALAMGCKEAESLIYPTISTRRLLPWAVKRPKASLIMNTIPVKEVLYVTS